MPLTPSPGRSSSAAAIRTISGAGSMRGGTPPPPTRAGSPARTIPASTMKDGCGSQPIRATTGPAPGGRMGSMAWRRRARGAGPPRCSSACQWGRNCAAPASRLTARPCSLRCSIQAPTGPKACTALGSPPPIRSQRRAGPISARIGLPGPRSLPSPRSVAARSPKTRASQDS